MDQETLVFLYRAYNEPHRRYHNLDHIAHLFSELKSVLLMVEDEVALRYAIWFHDVVYNPRATDNEEASSDVAAVTARNLGMSKEFIDRVRRLIMVTIHDPVTFPPVSNDEKLMCDLDLSALALPDEEFDANTLAIREEYAHVPDELFLSARRKFLQKILDREHIFYTEHFRTNYEDRARANLLRSLQVIQHLDKP